MHASRPGPRATVVGAPPLVLATALLAVAAPAAASIPGAPAALARAAVASDSVGQTWYDIPAQPLPAALAAYARQSGLRLAGETDAAAMGAVRSAPVSGAFTAAEALRRLLAGTGFAGRVDAAAGTATLARAGGAQALERVVVRAEPARRRGYAAVRTTTATRTDTPLRDTPQAVSIVTRELIADQAMQGMADVVRYVPGITMGQGEGHRDAPTIRGNASTADFYVDGVRDDAQYYRDVYNVERVEALKGSNAMVFGRGGGGGVVNRVTRQAQWAPTRALSLTGGSFDQRRGTLDVGQALTDRVAARVTGLWEHSGGFRDRADLRRRGINPTLAIAAGPRTTIRLGYERFRDDRTVDRGIPSASGRPSAAPITAFFGNPDSSYSRLGVDAASAFVEHATEGGLTIRNRTVATRYDKFYQNVFAGAPLDAGTGTVRLGGYNSGTDRANLFNQTDLTWGATTGAVRHTLLAGAEVGRQATDNTRESGQFLDAAGLPLAAASVPFAAPTAGVPVRFVALASDADNHVVAGVASLYAQDQVALSARWQAIVGLRWDRFALRVRNNARVVDGAPRPQTALARTDAVLSPRAGLVFKPATAVSLYGNYSVSFLPGSGDQFGGLTPTSQTLRPERFRNRELGAKWEVSPALSLTTAAYQLDRTNTTAPNPNGDGTIVQTGSQRTNGVELGVAGRVLPAWEVAGGWAVQTARLRSRTSAARAGATPALVPHTTLSLWNRVRLPRDLGVGLGVVHQGRMYAAIDNAVTLPAFTRLDAAVFLPLGRLVRAQLNVENLLDRRYFATSHGNNNIMPGASRTVRLTLGSGF